MSLSSLDTKRTTLCCVLYHKRKICSKGMNFLLQVIYIYYSSSTACYLYFISFISCCMLFIFHINGLVQERHNSSALAMELHLSCINPSISFISHKSSRNYCYLLTVCDVKIIWCYFIILCHQLNAIFKNTIWKCMRKDPVKSTPLYQKQSISFK